MRKEKAKEAPRHYVNTLMTEKNQAELAKVLDQSRQNLNNKIRSGTLQVWELVIMADYAGFDLSLVKR